MIEDTPTTVGVDTRARFAGGESRAKASDSVIERDIPAAAPDAVSSRAQKVQDNVNLVGLRDEERSISANFSSPECVQAMQESGKGQAVTAMSDKLFHFRRALRLCPNNPVFHNRLGEVYLSLTRNADAEYEFRQALSLEPEFKIAQNNLDRVTTIR